MIPMTAKEIIDLTDWCNEHGYSRDEKIKQLIMDMIHS